MKHHPSPFLPAAGLRSGHLQTVLASSPVRRRRVQGRWQAIAAQHRAVLVEAGEGIRLGAVVSQPPACPDGHWALLLHGWEGSAESSYVRAAAAQLLEAGFGVVRLNFRDHGDSHHLNREIFHSGRIDEVVAAAQQCVRQLAVRHLYVAGWSLGGNFALRLGLHAGAAGLPLRALAAVCPALDPAASLEAMEQGMAFYRRYFEHKWRKSLRKKRALFPHLERDAPAMQRLGMRALTSYLVARHTDYPSLEHYFDAYTLTGHRLAGLPQVADVLMSADDPVVPVAGFHALPEGLPLRLELAAHGGHCGFLEDWAMRGYGERWVRERFLAARAALHG